MGKRALENRVKKLQELEKQIAELEAEADAVRDEIKADMEAKGVDEIETQNYKVRWKEIVSNKFDSKAFKKDYETLYNHFLRKSVSKRFTIA